MAGGIEPAMARVSLNALRCFSLLMAVAVAGILSGTASAGDLKIPLPKRSQVTPVQRLNQEGVDAVRHHQYEKAKTLFYRAYLYDPDDPFTLNNLAYMAELDGQVDRAERLSALAARQTTDAVIERSSLPQLKGESFRQAITGVHDVGMQVSRANVGAVHLLSQGRGSEADALLQSVLAQDSRNPFTLNNLGVAKESEGDLDAALKYYSAAAATHAAQPAVVTYNHAWRGKPASEVAADNAQRLRKRIENETPQEQAALLNLRGVSAVNRNDWTDADHDFRGAYALDPYDAFSLNNLGYVAEASGDLETAQFFYEKARQASGAGTRVGLATRRSAEGMKLSDVSEDSDHIVSARMDQEIAARHRETGPVQLKTRDNRPVIEPSQPPASPASPEAVPPAPTNPQTPNP